MDTLEQTQAPETKPALTAVLVTTARKGVFFGYLANYEENKAKTVLELEQARCAIHWRGTRGFLGLAHTGPNENCRIGLPAPTLLLHEVTSLSTVTPEAVKAWESAPWR